MKSFKSIGMEVELFLTKYPPHSDNFTIFNANQVLERLLGTNINAVVYNDGINRGNFLQLSKYGDIRLTTDGTPVEFTGFRGDINHISQVSNFIEHFKSCIENVEKCLLKDYKLNSTCYYQSSDAMPYSAVFDNPGWIYSSEKMVYNAKTGEQFLQDKKEGNKKVTQRSIGLHLHLELSDKYSNFDINNRQIPDKIVNKLNKLFDNYYHNYDSINHQYREKLQPKDIYRIKKHDNSVQTLEYRRLTPVMLKNGGLFAFLCAADEAIQGLKV